MKLRQYFGTKAFLVSALTLAVPIMLQNLLTTSFSLVDTLMIGRLGEVDLAAVGFASAWANLMTVFTFGLTSGASIFFSQFWGARDEKGIHRALGIALTGCLLVACGFAAITAVNPLFVLRLFTNDQAAIAAGVSYIRIVAFAYPAMALSLLTGTLLRCTERVAIPLVGSAVGVIVNIVFNYALIFGQFGAPKMGIAGAAVASVLSAWVNLGVILLAGAKMNTLLIAGPRELFSFDRAFVKKYVLVSLPVLLNEMLWGTGSTVLNMVYGRMGTSEFAALTAFRTIDNFVTNLFVSISNAATVLIGKRVGAGELKEAYHEARAISCWTPVISVCFSVVIILLRGPIISIFGLHGGAHQVAMALMLLAAAEYPIRFIPFVQIVGIFRAGGDARTGMLMDLLGVWVISVPVAVVCGLVLGWPFLLVYGIVVLSDGAVKTILCVRYFITRRWIRPVTGHVA